MGLNYGYKYTMAGASERSSPYNNEKSKKKVNVFSADTGILLHKFDSIVLASDNMKLNKKTIGHHCRINGIKDIEDCCKLENYIFQFNKTPIF